MAEVHIPYKYEPRSYQLPILEAIDEGYKRLIVILHRRAGKDVTTWNLIIKKAFERVGGYLYIFPTASLGRRVIWQGANKDGFRFLDYLPPELIKRSIEQQMTIELVNGSIIQIVGSDRFTNVGINPVGIVFSEFALQKPDCWEYLRPVLRENGGWALFQSTPRGMYNHMYDLYKMAQHNDKWFVYKKGYKDTGALTDEDIEEERRAGMSDDLIEQEFNVSFTRGADGSYYSRYLEDLTNNERIGYFPWNPDHLVHVSFDLGIRDASSLWFFQIIGTETRFIRYYEKTGQDIAHYVRKMHEFGYQLGDVILPHDAKVRELGTGISRVDTFRRLGIDRVHVLPQIPVMDGIECTRNLFPNFTFHHQDCKVGLKHLGNYRREWSEDKKMYKDQPIHDEASHCADSLRYCCLGIKKGLVSNELYNASEFSDLNAQFRSNIIM